jgi:hypothetical protein
MQQQTFRRDSRTRCDSHFPPPCPATNPAPAPAPARGEPALHPPRLRLLVSLMYPVLYCNPPSCTIGNTIVRVVPWLAFPGPRLQPPTCLSSHLSAALSLTIFACPPPLVANLGRNAHTQAPYRRRPPARWYRCSSWLTRRRPRRRRCCWTWWLTPRRPRRSRLVGVAARGHRAPGDGGTTGSHHMIDRSVGPLLLLLLVCAGGCVGAMQLLPLGATLCPSCTGVGGN